MAARKNLLAGCVFCVLAASGFAEEESKPSVSITKVYGVADLVGKENFTADAQQLIDQVKRKIGSRWDKLHATATPFEANRSIVVSAPDFLHEIFATQLDAVSPQD
ncbi:hypothetical protein GC197_13045 [bacterium]|nr:hypothetical protein [bacterium]